MTDEARLQADIEALRPKFPDTQDLYREVSMILFFRYGITPTANKLYQLVRKGSMSAPAEALARFWDNLREKSRVRIEHPGIPQALQEAAGELTAKLWQQARAQADEACAAIRLEAAQQIEAASLAVEQANQREAVLRQDVAAAQALTAAMSDQIRVLEQRLAHDEGLRAGLAQQVQQLTDQQQALAQLVESSKVGEQRAAEEHKRLLLEIDRERGNAARAQKDLESLRFASDNASVLHEARLGEAQAQLAQSRQDAVELQIALATAKVERDQLRNRLLPDETSRHVPTRRRANTTVSRTPNRRTGR